MPSSIIEFKEVSKQYSASVLAIKQVSFSVKQGVILALLGASGCGKTTTLRLIAGLERPESGEIWLNGQCVAGGQPWIPPEQRRIGMMFQDYALFPHMTVAGNINFALKDWKRREKRQQVQAMLDLVGLPDMGKRYPHQLSGGQQQRVALARALANRPDVVLLDEPFSNLDAAMRKTTREEVRAILKKARATTIFVTHDQEEALSIADVVAVMKQGEILQIGTPEEIYIKPMQREVAAFVGEANFIVGEAQGDIAHTSLGDIRLQHKMQGRVDVLVRPEMIDLVPTAEGNAEIVSMQFLGHDMLIQAQLVNNPETIITCRIRTRADLALQLRVQLKVNTPAVAYIY